MSWKSRIREAFEAAGGQIEDAVLAELADHAADLEAELQRQGNDDASVVRQVSRQIAVWVAEAPVHRMHHAPAPDRLPSLRLSSAPCGATSAMRSAVSRGSLAPSPWAPPQSRWASARSP